MKLLFCCTSPESPVNMTRVLLGAAVLSSAVLLSACGAGSGTASSQSGASGEAATGVTTLHMDVPADASVIAQQTVQPGFHIAPVILDAPSGIDIVDNAASARAAPAVHYVPQEFQNLSSRQLTLAMLQSIRQQHMQAGDLDAAAKPMSTSAVMTYTPAQIRAAYGLPALPATGASLSAAQAASLGAGQTIYLIDAQSDPNVVAELAAFNQEFGLPGCTTTSIASNASLPLAAASTTTCQLSVVYSTANATMTSTAPSYDSGWATEITLDVQWSHATAPLARIILIEAPDASSASLLGAINLANAMGPGAVSMSFGTPEGSWTTSYDASFSQANMSYLAATGDGGTGVEWPSVSSHVLAVGGTSLTYSGSGSRSEVAWSDTGGGISAYVAKPSYQSSAIPDLGSQSTRAVADVSFNADPNTGQYLAVISPGSSGVSWLSAGGTSLATPQWAGLLAIANAQRSLASKAVLGAPHSALYAVASSSGNYASGFLDVTQGSDGSCTSCTAHVGYDEVTGLGTPNVGGLLTQLSGAASTAPVVSSAAIGGMVGTALSFTVSVTAPDAVTYALSGQPSGMTINSSGAVSWATPVLGTFAVTVTAKDSKTGLSGSGVYTVTVSNPPAPIVSAESISGKVGTALSFNVAVTSPDALTYTLTNQPSGMSISMQGVVSWATPLAGIYAVTVTAKDSKTGLTGAGVYTITIAAKPAPAVTGANINGTVGTALSFAVTVNAPDAVTYSLSGAPAGLAISSSGVVTWAKPVAGTYSVTVTAKDSVTGLSGSGLFTVTISSQGPSVVAAAMTGQVGKALTGSITISDTNVQWVEVSIAGAPMGMSFSGVGLTITASWPSPVKGSYTLKITVVDSAGRSTQISVPVTVAAS